MTLQFYRWPVRPPAKPLAGFPRPPVIVPAREPAETLPELIQGVRASSLEARVAVALSQLGFSFRFQVNFFGGRRLRGGQVVDFMVDTRPLPTPIYVQGEYWHKGQQKTIDRFNQDFLFFRLQGQISRPIVLFGQDLQSLEQTIQVLRRLLR